MKSVLELAERCSRSRDNRIMALQDNARGIIGMNQKRQMLLADRTDRLGIRFLDGDCQAIWQECRKTKNALGWTGKFISEGVPMLLAILYENNFEGRAMQAMVSVIKQYIDMRKSMMTEFSERFLQWKKQTVIPEDVKKEILAYLTKQSTPGWKQLWAAAIAAAIVKRQTGSSAGRG